MNKAEVYQYLLSDSEGNRITKDNYNNFYTEIVNKFGENKEIETKENVVTSFHSYKNSNFQVTSFKDTSLLTIATNHEDFENEFNKSVKGVRLEKIN